MEKLDWGKWFDHIYCIHFTEYRAREESISSELRRVDILDSGIFSFYYTFPSPLDDAMLASSTFMCERKTGRYSELSKPQFNLAKGHYSAIKEALGRGFGRILILEDDIAFLRDLGEIARILDASPGYDIELYDKCGTRKNWDYFRNNCAINADYCGYTLLWNGSCYGLNERGMRHIAESQEKKFNVADFYTNAFAPYNNEYGQRYLTDDGIRRACALKSIACQTPSTIKTVTDRGEGINWVYLQSGLDFCDLEPELYNFDYREEMRHATA